MNFTGFNNADFTFNDSATLPRVSLNAYSAVFAQHPDGHHVSLQDPGNSHHHAHDYFKSVLKTGANQLIDETEVVTESIAQHKYSQLANASYTYYNSKGNADTVHDGLDSSYIDDLSGFRVDTDLSSRDNVVLHNSATGETHVAYRGTADREFFKDWKVNGEIAGGSTHTTRVKDAQVQFDNVASKYGKNNLTVSGHSQGGHVSYEMAVRNDVEGFHYNPAINSTQVRNAGQYAGNVSQQMVYKQPLDFASPLAYNKNLAKSNTKLNIVQNLHG